MRTPTIYTKNLKDKIITKDMLIDCLYSSNKRAKNWRDKESSYRYKRQNNRYYIDKYDSEEKAREQKKSYYVQKEKMLSIIKPICIHSENYGYERRRIYDDDPEYYDYLGKFVWQNSYYDPELREVVYFGDIEMKDCPLYHYYLFYDLGGNHTFHTPINEDDVPLYKLEVVEIGKLNTSGYEVTDLISNQFVKKLIDLIESGEYRLEI